MEINVLEAKHEQFHRIRVCAYCRVSTEEDEQANSLENQMSHYEEAIRANPKYELAGIYSDFGVSGFKENRPGFQKMLEAARKHEFDLIITKSVSRFCRNTDTLLKAVRELNELGIGVIFELQHINTLAETGEVMLTVLAAFAQAESENYSILGKMTYRRKYQAGIPVQYLERSFGYTLDAEGRYIPDPDQEPWVKKIYELCSEGYGLTQIAAYLNRNGVKTTAGASFTAKTVVRILENEIYKGDYIMHKNYVNAERKRVRNHGEVDAWYIQDDHVPIVSRKLWDAAQAKLSEMRDYYSTGSVVGYLNEVTYPYMNQIFCAECGFPLQRRVYSHGNRVCWICGGQQRYHKKFCNGVNVPDSVIRNWGRLPGNIYIRKETDDLGKASFKYVRESTWKKDHERKWPESIRRKLAAEPNPYRDHFFCARCGAKLTREVKRGHLIWRCSAQKEKGREFCSGVSVPDDVIRGWGRIKNNIFIEMEVDQYGQRYYFYSSQKDPTGKCEKQAG